MLNFNLLSFYRRFSNDNKFFLLADQALYALLNFGSIILLSKFADTKVFGSLVIFQSYTNFLFIFSTFFLSAPILVLLVKKWADKKFQYLSILLSGNFLINLAFSFLLYILISSEGINIGWWFIFIIPFLMSFFDILKKYFYSNKSNESKQTTFASLVLTMIFFSLTAFSIKELYLETILTIYTLSFLGGSSYLILYLLIKKEYKKLIGYSIKHFKKDFAETIDQHYKYSKWIILGAIAFWGYTQGLFIFAKKLHISDLGIAKLRTAQNILGITNIFIVAIENYYIPKFSLFIKNNTKKALDKRVSMFFKKNFLPILTLIFLVYLAANALYYYFYQSKYGSAFNLLIIFTISQLLLFFIRPYLISLKALQITSPFFYAHTISLLVMVMSGYVLIPVYGVEGVAITFLLSIIFFSLVVYYFYSKKISI